MSKGRKLAKNTAIISFGKICTQIISYLLLPLYTAYLTTSEYGTVDLINTLVSLFVPIITFELDQGIFRFLIDCRNDEKETSKLISTTIFFIITQSAILAIIYIFIVQFITNEYKYYLLAYLIVNSLLGILLNICRGIGDNKQYTIASFINGILTVLLNVYLIAFIHLGARGMLLANILGQNIGIIYIFIAKKMYRYINIKNYDKNLIKKLLKFSFPLVPNALSWWIVNISDRLIISGILGISQNGIYSIANKFPNLISTFFGFFNLAWTESAAENYKEKDKDIFYTNVFNKTIEIFGSACILIITLMPFVFNVLINEQYKEAYNQIPILMFGSLFNTLVIFLGSIYIANKKTKEIAKTTTIAAIINIVIHLLLINYIGLYAASVSTLIAWLSMFIYRYIDAKKYVNIKMNYKIFISMILLMVISTITYYINNNMINLIILLITLVYAIAINKNNIVLVKKIITDKVKKNDVNSSIEN